MHACTAWKAALKRACLRLPSQPVKFQNLCLHSCCFLGYLARCLATPEHSSASHFAQAFLDPRANPEYNSSWSTYRHITRQHGMGILFSGLGPRAVRIVGATMILQTVRTTLVGFLESAHSESIAKG